MQAIKCNTYASQLESSIKNNPDHVKTNANEVVERPYNIFFQTLEIAHFVALKTFVIKFDFGVYASDLKTETDADAIAKGRAAFDKFRKIK